MSVCYINNYEQKLLRFSDEPLKLCTECFDLPPTEIEVLFMQRNAKKSNLKNTTKNEMNDHQIFFKESYMETHGPIKTTTKLLKDQYIEYVWTYDGRIMAETLSGKQWTIIRVHDINILLQIVKRGPQSSTHSTK